MKFSGFRLPFSKKAPAGAFLLAAAAALVAGTPLPAGAETPAQENAASAKKPGVPVVRRITYRIEGPRKVSADVAAAHLSLSEGKPFLTTDVAESVRALYATGLFDYVGIEPSYDPDGRTVDAEVTLIPRPILADVYFRGNKAVGNGSLFSGENDDLRGNVRRGIAAFHDPREADDALSDLPEKSSSWFSGLSEECASAGLIAGAPLDEAAVRRAVRKIREKYRGKDYPFTNVSYEIRRDDEAGTAYVVFTVEENLETRIASVEFVGNETFSSKELRGLLDTTSWAWGLDFTDFPDRLFKFSWITDRGYFNKTKFEADVETLRNFYLNKGFLDVEIHPPTESELRIGYSEVNNDETLGYLPIEIAIVEGRRYTLGNVRIRGNKLGETHRRFTEEGILAMLAKISPRGVRRKDEAEFDRLVSGDWYSPEAANVAAQKIREYYGEVGYLNARVSVSREPDTETGKVDLVFTVTENEKSYLRSITIEGNDVSKSEIILRDLALAPGEVFDLVRMKTSERRVRGTRYFDYVSIQPVDTGVPSQKDMRISVREGRTGSLSFGAGFSTVESVSGFAEFQQSNFDLFNSRNKFRGGGQKFRFRVQIGTKSTQIIQSLEEPMLFGRELALGYEAYHKSNKYISNDYDTVDTGLKIYLGRRVIENVRAELYYKIDNYEITDIEYDVPQFVRDEEGYTLLSRGGLALSRDTRDDALFPTSGNRVRLCGEVVGGPFMGDCDYYSLDLQAAQWFPVVDYDQSLKIGGRIGTMHAYGGSYVPFFERLYLGGPYNLRGFRYGHVGPFEGDEPMGGQSRFYVTAEYTIRLLDELRIAFFYDGGFVNADSFDFSPSDWNDDVGFGFRILMLGALMNIDFGFPIHTGENNDDGMRLQFSFGTNF